MTKHTPGPWDLQETLISHGSKRPLARIWNEHENWEANARLIAAAPELLAALEDGINGGWKKEEHWENAKAAIAKAKWE